MNTETAQDKMIMRDQDGNVILETPCIGTACGSVLTVEVTPNCGDTTDTVWAFSVSC